MQYEPLYIVARKRIGVFFPLLWALLMDNLLTTILLNCDNNVPLVREVRRPCINETTILFVSEANRITPDRNLNWNSPLEKNTTILFLSEANRITPDRNLKWNSPLEKTIRKVSLSL